MLDGMSDSIQASRIKNLQSRDVDRQSPTGLIFNKRYSRILQISVFFSQIPVGLYAIAWSTGRRPWIGLELFNKRPWKALNVFRSSGAGTLLKTGQEKVGRNDKSREKSDKLVFALLDCTARCTSEGCREAWRPSPRVWPVASSGLMSGRLKKGRLWRGRPGIVHCFCMCGGGALLGGLFGISQSLGFS